MKTKQDSKLDIRHSSFIAIGTALLAAITLFATAPRASAQTGPGYDLSFNGTSSYVAVNAQNVPIGNSDYTIEAWTATFGTQEQKVTVGPKESKTLDFTFKGA